MVQITPEIQAQLDEQKKQCIFCKIIAKEMDSKIVYEDDKVLATLDINPWVQGHTLLMPKEHYPIIPYLPAETFKHMFGLLPSLSKSLKDALLCSGLNVFVANGGPAGQQSPHFLIHLLPRERGDGLEKYTLINPNELSAAETKEAYDMIANNLPIMMRNHFGRNPASWHNGSIPDVKEILEIKKEHRVIYEDEKALCVVPFRPLVKGHLMVLSQTNLNNFEELDAESAAHLFYTASFGATAVFEGLGAHGTNIILKTGETNDNANGLLALHILPRYSEDGLDLLGTTMQPKPDLDQLQSKISDKTFALTHKESKQEPVTNSPQIADTTKQVRDALENKNTKKDESVDKIKEAIRKIKHGL